MKARMHFDTLTYANKLKAAGMESQLAEVHAMALVEALEDGLATKTDLIDVRTELKMAIAELRTELKAEMAELKAEMTEQKSELIKWMISLFMANTAIIGAFIALTQFVSHTH